MNLLGYVPKTNNKSYKGNMKGTVKNLLLKKHVDEKTRILTVAEHDTFGKIFM